MADRATTGARALVRAIGGGMSVWAVLGLTALFAVMIPPGGGRSTSNAGMTLATVAGVVVAWPLLRRALASAGTIPPLAWAMAVVCVLWSAVSALSWALHDSPTRWSWTWTAQPLILLAAVSLLLWLLQEPRRWPAAVLASLAGTAVAATIVRLGLTGDSELWRYALGPSLTPLALVLAALAWHTGLRVAAAVVVSAVTVANLALGLRSALLQVVLAVAAAILYGVVSTWISRRWALPVVGIGTVLVVALLVPVYGAAAGSGALGEVQRLKWQAQSDAVGGILLGGRPEFRLAMEVLPLVPAAGLGFAPDLPPDVSRVRDALALELAAGNDAIKQLPGQYWAQARGNDITVTLRYWGAEGHGLYLHSALFQSWLWIGPYAVVPFGLVLVAALLLVSRSARRFGTPGVLGSTVLLAAYVWNSLFSPMSPSSLTLMALIVALACAFEVHGRREAAQQAATGGGAGAGRALDTPAGHESQG